MKPDCSALSPVQAVQFSCNFMGHVYAQKRIFLIIWAKFLSPQSQRLALVAHEGLMSTKPFPPRIRQASFQISCRLQSDMPRLVLERNSLVNL